MPAGADGNLRQWRQRDRCRGHYKMNRAGIERGRDIPGTLGPFRSIFKLRQRLHVQVIFAWRQLELTQVELHVGDVSGRSDVNFLESRQQRVSRKLEWERPS